MRLFAGDFLQPFLLGVLCFALLRPAQGQEESPSKTTSKAGTADHGLPQVKRINEEVRRVWNDSKLHPSPTASDGEWCRRVYLDVLGRVPSVQELREFLTQREADKKAKLVAKLLHDDAHTEDYARNWATIWTNILIGRNGGLERRSLINREGMQKYLRDSFARGKPYDKMVYELVTATGSTNPSEKDFNGATNFLVMKLEENAAQATAMTAKIFLGLQVQCTQCHNHPFNEWKQQKFWEFNAFFRQTRALREFGPGGGRDVENVQLVNQDFAGEGSGAGTTEAIIYYELRNGLLQSAFPVFIDGAEINKSGYLSECDRRTELGKLMLQSPFLDKTIVNRMWQHFLGYGFTKPVDDLGPHNNPSHPELLAFLGDEVRQNSFNLKELIRWIVLSEPYSLSSKIMPQNKADDPLLGELPKFTHFYLRQMQAEELYESLLVATQAHKSRGSYEEQEKLKAEWMRQFVVAFGTDEGDEATTFNGTIPQALMLMNGELVKKAIDPNQGSFLYTIATDNRLKPGEKIQYLFEAAVARRPTQNEINIANQLLVAREMDRQRQKGKGPKASENSAVLALQDIFWAVLNSNEFILQH
jgi:Protein of unknown function (DUF1549)/Protein of unknown function (DUF1553)